MTTMASSSSSSPSPSPTLPPSSSPSPYNLLLSTLHPKEYLHHLLTSTPSSPIRLDNRSPTSTRPLSITPFPLSSTPSTSSSSSSSPTLSSTSVSLGSTSICCSISMGIGKRTPTPPSSLSTNTPLLSTQFNVNNSLSSSPSSPITIDIDISTLANEFYPSLSSRPPDFLSLLSHSISSFTHSLFSPFSSLLSSLSLPPPLSPHYIHLFIDILVLSADGNLSDSIMMGIKSSLELLILPEMIGRKEGDGRGAEVIKIYQRGKGKESEINYSDAEKEGEKEGEEEYNKNKWRKYKETNVENEKERKEKVSSSPFPYLPLYHLPSLSHYVFPSHSLPPLLPLYAFTFVVLSNILLTDPTHMEEELADTKIVISLIVGNGKNIKSKLCGVNITGNGVEQQVIDEAISRSEIIGREREKYSRNVMSEGRELVNINEKGEETKKTKNANQEKETNKDGKEKKK